MNKIKLSVLVLVTLFISATVFISCSKDENTENISTLNEESAMLKKAYDFESISYNNDMSSNTMFNSSTNLEAITLTKSNANQNLNLKNVTQINWKNKKISYLIPFLDNSNKSIVITIEKNDFGKSLNFTNSKMVENNVNVANGNGKIILTDAYGSTEKTFEDGILIEKTDIYGKTFKECFEQAYNDICDGFIGCASWYSSPLPALTAVAYCGATT